MSRPSTYDRAGAELVLAAYASAKFTLAEATEAQGIKVRTWHAWVRDDRDGLARSYQIAREMRATALEDEILEIADDGRNDWIERRSKKGNAYRSVDHESVQRSKLRVDARKYLLSVMNPRVYGPRQEIELTPGEIVLDAASILPDAEPPEENLTLKGPARPRLPSGTEDAR